MEIVADPVPVPEQFPAVVIATARPDEEFACTVKLVLYEAAPGADWVTVIVWLAFAIVSVPLAPPW